MDKSTTCNAHLFFPLCMCGLSTAGFIIHEVRSRRVEVYPHMQSSDTPTPVRPIKTHRKSGPYQVRCLYEPLTWLASTQIARVVPVLCVLVSTHIARVVPTRCVVVQTCASALTSRQSAFFISLENGRGVGSQHLAVLWQPLQFPYYLFITIARPLSTVTCFNLPFWVPRLFFLMKICNPTINFLSCSASSDSASTPIS